MKIGIPKEYRIEGLSEEIEALWAKGSEMLADAGAQFVIVGHSERRAMHGESDAERGVEHVDCAYRGWRVHVHLDRFGRACVGRRLGV